MKTNAHSSAVRAATPSTTKDVFTGGLADPSQWSNYAFAIDTGANWYPNRYTKVYMDWQHSYFGSPVFNGKGRLASHVDLLWLRFQIFF